MVVGSDVWLVCCGFLGFVADGSFQWWWWVLAKWIYSGGSYGFQWGSGFLDLGFVGGLGFYCYGFGWVLWLVVVAVDLRLKGQNIS